MGTSPNVRKGEAGLSLIEVVIGGAIAAFVLLAVLSTTHTFIGGAQHVNARIVAQSNAGQLAERLTTEASSAWAVFVPATDVLGRTNADGHEVDFFSEDGSHRPYASAYDFDSASRLITRYAYAPGIAASADETFGAFDVFAATGGDITALTDPANALYDPLFAHASAPIVRYTFSAMNVAAGGNGIVRVHVTGAGVDRNEMLTSATAPTTFTVVIPYTPAPVPSTPPPAPLPTWAWTPPP